MITTHIELRPEQYLLPINSNEPAYSGLYR